MSRIAVVSAGAFGTAVASVLARNGNDVRLHIREPDVFYAIRHTKMNSYLPSLELDLTHIFPTMNLAEAVAGADIVFFAIPTQFARGMIEILSSLIDSNAIIVLTTKGRPDKFDSLSDVFDKVLPSARLCGLYGITFAELLAHGKGMSSMCIAAHDPAVREEVAQLFRSDTDRYFRVYLSSDIKGVQFCGAMKNVYAIAMGLVDGYLEARPSEELQSRRTIQNECAIEFIRFGLTYGAELHTLIGPAGIGDIIASSTPPCPSRNYQFGKWLALTELGHSNGVPPSVHEGYDTCAAMVEIAKLLRVSAPILDLAYQTLFDEKTVQDAMPELFATLGSIKNCESSDSFNSIYDRSVKQKRAPSAVRGTEERSRGSVFVSYRFVEDSEPLIAIVKSICALNGIEVVTGHSVGFRSPEEGISSVIESKLRQSDYYLAVFTKGTDEARWLAAERTLAIGFGKPMLILLEEGASERQLGELRPEHVYHRFTRQNFASIVEQHLRECIQRPLDLAQ